MPRQFRIAQGDEDEDEDLMDHGRHRKHHTNKSFWRWGCLLLLLATLAVAIAALAYAMSDDAHWMFVDKERIVSRHDGADVEVKEGGNLVVHNSIVDSYAHTVYEKIVLDPLFGPEGPNLLFGAANATYTRLQAFYALGFRVWDRFFIPLGGIFASNGLFGEDGLAVALDTFANWIHGPIIGTGPGLLILSDEDAKENVKSLDSGVALGKVSKLEPRSFDWKGAKSESAAKLPAKTLDSMTNVHGFVAQEVGAVVPSAVRSTTDFLPDDTELAPQALMDYNALIVELVGAVQSLWANGVIVASRGMGPVNTQPFSPCFNATTYHTPRAKARCICTTMRCGPSGNQACADVVNACGRDLV